MIGGKVIENKIVRQPETSRKLRRLWCVDTVYQSDELAVYTTPDNGKNVQGGDDIWWQSGKIYWSRGNDFRDVPMPKVGYSFDPRKSV